ncbi:MAG: phospholipid carrier-dependent glycosyltransferase [Chloroflexi bacterium]|nr:MAG: phospholipid carrier-dependent glycosyltransferase [Chloroflexota bacterium]MBL1194310.1 phospholipid carrier-dependent glycosyltransferase [Chloroflexota bacterium]NOH11600.1 phospholipid carrier-dependent glycosyltransferase [Chloroflexota bacterium]
MATEVTSAKKISESSKSFSQLWTRPGFWPTLALIGLLALGLALRLVDLTDPPFDFHPTRQFRGAMVARSLYYSVLPSSDPNIQATALGMRDQVVEYEPPFLEAIVVAGYLLTGGENLWVARIVTSVSWVLGGLVLYLLAKRTVGIGGALIATAYYLFLPFSVYASRSFQPDPFMVMWVLFTMYAVYRWSEERTWKWAITTAVLAAVSVLVKVVAAYLIGGMMVGVVLATLPIREALRDRQVWAMGLIMVVFPGVYYIFGISGSSSNYLENWVFALMPLILEPAFYVRWMNRLNSLIELAPLMAGAAGVLIAQGRLRAMLIGLWVGYIIYGLTLPHQTTTHSYYHIQLVPIVALSLAPVAQLVVDRVWQEKRFWRLAFIGVMALTIAYPAWIARSTMLGEDHSHEPPYWESIGEIVPDDGKTMGLVQQYGHLLIYYGWENVKLWPVTGEQRLAELRGAEEVEFVTEFKDRTEGVDYFLVTAFGQLNQQEQLKDYLYTNFPILDEGNGYVLFDLRGQEPK